MGARAFVGELVIVDRVERDAVAIERGHACVDHRGGPHISAGKCGILRGKRLAFTYSTVNGCYCAAYTSNTYVHASMRVAYEGRIGRGLQQLGLSRAHLTRDRDAPERKTSITRTTR